MKQTSAKLVLCSGFTPGHNRNSLVPLTGVESSGSTLLNKHMAEE